MENPHDSQAGTRPSDIVCIVDPNLSVRASLTLLLEDLARVQSFETGEHFLELLWSDIDLPSVLIAESSLPGISGLALFERLHEEGQRIPTIIIASQSNVREAVLAMQAGVHDYFEKPFNAFLVRSSVEIALTQSC